MRKQKSTCNVILLCSVVFAVAANIAGHDTPGIVTTDDSRSVAEKNGTHSDILKDQAVSDNDLSDGCRDWQGKPVADGEKYVPHGNDMCMQCTCDNHFPILCHSVACSPPLNCARPELTSGACCEYTCLDGYNPSEGNGTNPGDNGEKDGGESITNLSLRLIASTVTSFLVLALLLFMVHRLRQRRLLLAMRRFEARARHGQAEDTDSDAYIPEAFMSLECPPYTDPPPPYSPPKPPQIFPGEQPPPYEEISHTGQINNGLVSSNNNANSRDGGNRESRTGVAPSTGVGNSDRANTTEEGREQWRTQSEQEVSNQVSNCTSAVVRSGVQNNGTGRAHTLPAYASTDVVEGLGVVISPGSDLVSFGPGHGQWSSWRQGGGFQSENHNRYSSVPQERPPSLRSSSNGRVHSMPTTTAFQRFSNIFRRDSSKSKSRRRDGRPMSEYSAPPQYATVPRSEHNPPTNYAAGNSRQNRGEYGSGGRAQRFMDRMAFSLDSSRAAYELGAVSPSSSSQSSSSTDNPHLHAFGTYANNSLATPILAATATTVAPSHMQEFQEDLRRHLPPIQLPDVPEVPVTQANSTRSHARDIDVLDDVASGGQEEPPKKSSVVSGHYPPSSQTVNTIVASNQQPRQDLPVSPPRNSLSIDHSSASHHSPTSHPAQQSLASFIRSNPSATIADIREQIYERGGVGRGDKEGSSSSTKILNNLPLGAVQCGLEEVAGSSLGDIHASTLPRAECRHEGDGVDSPNLMQSVDDQVTGLSTATGSSAAVSQFQPGAMRRSHSAVSQISVFSVCSETGEKRLKNSGEQDEDGRVLSADSQYPEHHSLGKGRSGSAMKFGTENSTLSSVRSPTPSSAWVAHTLEDSNQSGVASSSAHASPCPVSAADSLYTSSAPQIFRPSAIASVPAHSHQQHFNHSSTALSASFQGPQITSSVRENCSDLWNKLDSGQSKTNNHATGALNSFNIPPSADVGGEKDLPPSQSAHGAQGDRRVKNEKVTDMPRKPKKNRAKERSTNSPQHAPNWSRPKVLSSPQGQEKSKDKSAVQVKIETASSEKQSKPEGKGKSFRSGEKKRRGHYDGRKQGSRQAEGGAGGGGGGGGKSGKSSEDPASSFYGNADVYRGIGCEADPVASRHTVYQLYHHPWEPVAGGDAVPAGIDVWNSSNSTNALGNHHKGASPGGRIDSRRKVGGHRRQVSTGDKLGHTPSPVRQKSRPKSASVPTAEKLPEKRWDPSLRSPLVVTGEVGLPNKGARSGFGHDLNFDDQSGVADLFAPCVDQTSYNRGMGRNSLSLENPMGSYRSGASRIEGDGGSVSRNGPSMGGHSGGSKSGLSQNLSFVSRGIAGVGASRAKKRQSLPTLPSTFSQTHDSSGVNLAHSAVDGGQYAPRPRGERSSHQVEGQADTTSEEANEDAADEATSYV